MSNLVAIRKRDEVRITRALFPSSANRRRGTTRHILASLLVPEQLRRVESYSEKQKINKPASSRLESKPETRPVSKETGKVKKKRASASALRSTKNVVPTIITRSPSTSSASSNSSTSSIESLNLRSTKPPSTTQTDTVTQTESKGTKSRSSRITQNIYIIVPPEKKKAIVEETEPDEIQCRNTSRPSSVSPAILSVPPSPPSPPSAAVESKLDNIKLEAESESDKVNVLTVEPTSVLKPDSELDAAATGSNTDTASKQQKHDAAVTETVTETVAETKADANLDETPQESTSPAPSPPPSPAFVSALPSPAASRPASPLTEPTKDPFEHEEPQVPCHDSDQTEEEEAVRAFLAFCIVRTTTLVLTLVMRTL